MTLLSDLKAWYSDAGYPPDGPELDWAWDETSESWSTQNTKTKQVSYKTIDTSGRWGNQIEVVYQRGDELVAVYDMEPATEMQYWGDYGEPDIVPVEAYEVTITKYRRLT